MKILAAAILCLFFAIPAFAQDKGPQDKINQDKPDATVESDSSDKQVLEQCQAAALAKDMDAEARRKAIAACIIAAKPKVVSRLHCLMDPRLKAMDKEARLVAIKDCMEGKPIEDNQ